MIMFFIQNALVVNMLFPLESHSPRSVVNTLILVDSISDMSIGLYHLISGGIESTLNTPDSEIIIKNVA